MNKCDIILILAPPHGGGETARDAVYAAIDRSLSSGGALDDVIQTLMTKLEIDPLRPAPVQRSILTSPELREDRLRVRQCLLDDSKTQFPLIFYHPASVALLPFWQSVFEDTDFKVHYTLLVSNPLQVIDRLRDETQLVESLRLTLWTQTMVQALEYAPEHTRLFHYPDFLRYPEKTIDTIIGGLADTFRQRTEGRQEAIEAALSPVISRDLAYTTKDLLDHETTPDFVKKLYTELRDLGEETHRLSDDQDKIAALISGKDEISFLLGAMETLTRRNRTLETKLKTLTANLDQLSQTNTHLQATIERMEKARQTSSEEVTTLNSKIVALESDLTKARTSNNEKIGILTEKNENLTQSLSDSESAIDDLQTLLEKNRELHEEKQQSLILENTRLTEKTSSIEKHINDIKRERTHDQHRFNIERASLLKQHKQKDETFKTIIKTLTGDSGTSDLLEDEQSDEDPSLMAIKTNKNLNALKEQLAQKETTVETLRTEQQNLEERARTAERQLLDQDASLAEAKMEAEAARQEVQALKASTSWKISAPIRRIKTAARRPTAADSDAPNETTPAKKPNGSISRPPSPSPKGSGGKALIKTGLYSTLPFLFSGTASYKSWQSSRQIKTAPNRVRQGDLAEDDDRTGASLPKALITKDLDSHVALTNLPPVREKKARALAFYLPQFHQTPENDEWWGEGFTEWTNVKPAQPQFDGHYQPHIPGDLGYYDLAKDETILHRQTELARQYGLSGFAMYFYWFAGKRLLEDPLQKYLNDKTIDFPFCLCWANENWSRRWDGASNQMLIEQNHSPEDDIAFIEHVAQYLRDDRYIRVNGKPLLIVYRPGMLPSARETSERWRIWCRENGIGEIYLAYTQSFEKLPPALFGFDAAIEFPPNNHGLVGNPSLVPSGAENFSGKVFDWRDLFKRSENYPLVQYPLFRGVNPSWDNTARRKANSTVLLNSAPSLYCQWLDNAIQDTTARVENPDERLIFINAWNEWAEGAHLEPDERYGYAWLEATRRAISNDGPQAPINHLAEDDHDAELLPDIAPPPSKKPTLPDIAPAEKKILVVTHDLFRHGAQFLSLNFVRTLKERFGYQVHTLACADGPLRSHFEAHGPLTVVSTDMSEEERKNTLKALKDDGFEYAFVNSAASGWLSNELTRAGIQFIGLVHEMPSMIEKMFLQDGLRGFHSHARATVFPAQIVRNGAATCVGTKNWDNARIIPQGLYKIEGYQTEKARQTARARIRQSHAIPPDAILFIGVGYADHRKGIDLFLTWAIETIRKHPNCHFMWLGDIAADMRPSVDQQLASAKVIANNIHLPGFIADTAEYYEAADIYVLSSREDPFPSTALEALNGGTPGIMVAGTGGIEDIADTGCIRLMVDASADSFISTASHWIDDRAELGKYAETGRDLIKSDYGFVTYVASLLDQLGLGSTGVSAIIPGYNYERYIEKRLRSIIDQTIPPREIIYLDDASTDDSLKVATACLATSGINHKIIRNQRNSGNVFTQWQKGVNQVSHPVTWVAEADDWADEGFIETLLPLMTEKNTVIAYSESRQIDSNGVVIAPDYREYVRDVSPTKWQEDFYGSGLAEVAQALSSKNTIPNVSAVLFDTAALKSFLKTDIDFAKRFRTAGDWYIYANLLRHGDLAFKARPLNYHRRHEGSVTISKFDLTDLAEIAMMQSYIAREFSISSAQKAKARVYLDHLIDHFDMRSQYTDTDLKQAMMGTFSSSSAATPSLV